MSKGLVRIRLARFGRKHSPVYNIVVTNKHKALYKEPIEVLGTYDPIPKPLTKKELKNGAIPVKDVELDFNRVKYWIGVGAQPSDTVTRLLKKAGILDESWGKTYQSSRTVVEPRKEVLE